MQPALDQKGPRGCSSASSTRKSKMEQGLLLALSDVSASWHTPAPAEAAQRCVHLGYTWHGGVQDQLHCWPHRASADAALAFAAHLAMGFVAI